jgi:hypothetical protein
MVDDSKQNPEAAEEMMVPLGPSGQLGLMVTVVVPVLRLEGHLVA